MQFSFLNKLELEIMVKHLQRKNFKMQPDTSIEEMVIETEYAWSPFYRAIKDQDPDTGERELAGGKPDDDIYKDLNSDDLQYDEYHDSDLPSADISVSFYIIGYGQHENHNLYSKPVWLGVVHCWK